ADREAATLLEHGLALLDALPPTPERTLRTIRLSMILGRALTPAGGPADPAVERAYVRARVLSEHSDDSVQLFQALIALAAIYVGQARLGDAQQTAQQLEGLLTSMPFPPFVFAGSILEGMVKFHAGSLSEARQLLERALALGEVALPVE